MSLAWPQNPPKEMIIQRQMNNYIVNWTKSIQLLKWDKARGLNLMWTGRRSDQQGKVSLIVVQIFLKGPKLSVLHDRNDTCTFCTGISSPILKRNSTKQMILPLCFSGALSENSSMSECHVWGQQSLNPCTRILCTSLVAFPYLLSSLVGFLAFVSYSS